MKYKEVWETVKNFQYINAKDEVRTPDAYKNGGKFCDNQEIVNTIRSVGKWVIKEIGRKIITGDFNLT